MKKEAKVEVYIKSKNTKFKTKDLELLKSIKKEGSINKAAEKLGRSYSHSQKRIDELENAFGKLITRQRGGLNGGGSKLTSIASELIQTLENKITDLAITANTEITEINGEIKNTEGDLAEIKTSIGTLKTRKNPWMETGKKTRVLIRADTITLLEPNKKQKTSALNTIEGIVTDIEKPETKGTVTIKLKTNNNEIKAIVTKNSLKNLNITQGKKLAATFKATATKAIPTKPNQNP
ncbi:TOBE domain-containing protein [Methanonatronarchaeum sp. AMET-Sl]|uniref:TOBE domain-containing protein n=1 Tax=Methanonatronarchaeum sp. AMET-Sl TaxID=3037654 RepID=UPI00244E4EC0|nr:TOBE domain-containing protein [Methanonatronarchaeum sp. AMET-Sl]WGI17985.1 LysR family transcriptional regulator [Methanonatronarchaeum sp. AMET-Sl]